MPSFTVSLTRSFEVVVETESAENAARMAEFFVGFRDESSVADRNHYQFQILDIEMVDNEAIDVVPLGS